MHLVEPWPLSQEVGCWAVMAEKGGVEDLANMRAHLSSSTRSTSTSNRGSYSAALVVVTAVLLVW